MRPMATARRLDAGDVVHTLARAAANDPRIVAAYVFGSVAAGRVTPFSDIDVGLLLTPGAADSEVCEDVADALIRQCGTDRVDVIPLHRAPLPLRYRVVRDGILGFSRDAAGVEVIRDREAHIRTFLADLRRFSDIPEAQFLENRERQLAFCMRCNWPSRQPSTSRRTSVPPTIWAFPARTPRPSTCCHNRGFSTRASVAT